MFSPYLTRLRSKTVGLVAGRDATGAVLTSLTGIPVWTPTTDAGSGLMSVAAANIGTGNGGFTGDVFVGTFREIPGLSAGENQGVLSDRSGASAFMLVNTVAYQLTDYTNPFSAGGTGADLRMGLTVTVDPSKVEAKGATGLYRLDRETGNPVAVPLARQGDAYAFTAELDGGAGELYLWG